jgi:disulfide bond formation protein DsbB
MTKRLFRYAQALLLLFTLFVVAASFYFQYVKGLQPCPLCIMQRASAFLIGMFCLMGMLLSTLRKGRLVTIMQMFFSAAGLFFVCRQLWLQSLPPEQTPACMPGFDILMRYFPWQDVMHALFWGAGDCAEVNWKWLNLTMPAWAGIYFVVILMSAGFMYWRLGRSLDYVR